MSEQLVTVRHTFEAGHRLPHIEGKCQSLHGHSWRASVTVAAPAADEDGMVVHFGRLKSFLREWIDARLDHGLMLGQGDELVPLLRGHGKVYVFGQHLYSEGLAWPTVENVAQLLARVAATSLVAVPHAEGAHVQRVSVEETAVNMAEWASGGPE